MKFIHIADVHLGAEPCVSKSHSVKRSQEIWNSFQRVVEFCEEEEADLLLIAGDLFHRQPLLRELKEVNACFSRLSHTKVILIAGNHDYVKKESYYRTFPWCEQVHVLLDHKGESVYVPECSTTVYGFSYEKKEITEPRYDTLYPNQKKGYHILLGHGGDERHVPIQPKKLLEHGFDYLALGHIHKPQCLVKGRAYYAGALEPIDKNDIGEHGLIQGELQKNGSHIQFHPFAQREYVHLEVPVTKEMRGMDVSRLVRRMIEERGLQHIYKLILKGFREYDVWFQLEELKTYGNVIEVIDTTKPWYDFSRLKRLHEGDLIGKYIESFEGCEEESIDYMALCEGLTALLETKR